IYHFIVPKDFPHIPIIGSHVVRIYLLTKFKILRRWNLDLTHHTSVCDSSTIRIVVIILNGLSILWSNKVAKTLLLCHTDVSEIIPVLLVPDVFLGTYNAILDIVQSRNTSFFKEVFLRATSFTYLIPELRLCKKYLFIDTLTIFFQKSICLFVHFIESS